jgi:GTPase
VRRLHRRLEEQQALLRFDRADPPADGIADHRFAVLVRLEAKHRQLEASLSVLGCVAGCHGATVFRQDRSDVIEEMYLRLVLHAAHRHRHVHLLVAVRHVNGGRSILHGEELPGGAHLDDGGIGRLVLRQRGDVVAAASHLAVLA